MNQLTSGEAVMASTRASRMGDRMSLAVRMVSNTIEMPAKTTTDTTSDFVDVSAFMLVLHNFMK